MNPKKAFGDKKLPLHLLPIIAEVEWAKAMADGARKYGPFNWRENPVDSQTYVGGIERHLKKWIAGEIYDDASGAHHLGHVMANCALLMDAEACDTLDKWQPSASEKAALESLYAFEKD